MPLAEYDELAHGFPAKSREVSEGDDILCLEAADGLRDARRTHQDTMDPGERAAPKPYRASRSSDKYISIV